MREREREGDLYRREREMRRGRNVCGKIET